jgi:hypothetical protein
MIKNGGKLSNLLLLQFYFILVQIVKILLYFNNALQLDVMP